MTKQIILENEFTTVYYWQENKENCFEITDRKTGDNRRVVDRVELTILNTLCNVIIQSAQRRDQLALMDKHIRARVAAESYLKSIDAKAFADYSEDKKVIYKDD